MITSHQLLALRIRDLYSGYLLNRDPPEVGAFHRSIPYVSGGGRKQSLDIIVPREAAGVRPYPLLFYLHGGGWHLGDKRSPTRICKCFAHEGYLVLNINYRLAPGCGLFEQVSDVGKAVLWGRENARKYGGDPERLALAGESAGAHLASIYASCALDGDLSAALSIEEAVPPDSVKGLLLFYGVYDLESAVSEGSKATRAAARGLLKGQPGTLAERARLASPLFHVSEGYPPAFICSGETDDIHDQSVRFAAALSEAGVPLRTRFFIKGTDPEAPHGFLNAYTLESARIAMRVALDFLEESTGSDV